MKSKKAFTLIELLVVIAIIGILTTIAVISLNNARAKARDAKRIADVKQTQTALELYFNDNGHYPTTNEWSVGSIFSTSTLGTTTYMNIIPAAVNPPDGGCSSSQNSLVYEPSADGVSYTLSFCLGGVTGALATGSKCATPGGILNGACFVCGDSSIVYGGESYPTVDIDGQCWLAKNLNIGTRVDSLDGGSNPQDQSDNSIIEKYCYDDDSNNCSADGGLYQWNEAMQYSISEGVQGICPSGWHIQSHDELLALLSYLGSDPAVKLRNLDWNGDNTSGFSALATGFRDTDGSFIGLNDATYLWSSTIFPGMPDLAWFAGNGTFNTDVSYDGDYQTKGFSVRCLKD